MTILDRRYWIFDLDGTLTKPILDFPAIKRQLGLPQDRGILEVLETKPKAEAQRIHQQLDQIELEHAKRAEIAKGADEFLHNIKERDVFLGILTRNKKSHALTTLHAIGLDSYFEEPLILGRDEADPKPSPDGIDLFLKKWAIQASEAVMVGDFRHDLEAGRAAGTATIYVDQSGAFPYADLADISVTSLDELLTKNGRSVMNSGF